jgi:hypothetical protein
MILFPYIESTISRTVSSVLTYALLVETDWLLKLLILFFLFQTEIVYYLARTRT